MKKLVGMVCALVMICCLCISAPAEDLPGYTADGEQIVIGFAYPSAQEDIWVKAAENVQLFGEEAGCKVICQNANLDVPTQVAQIQNMILQGVDVIIVGSVDNASLANVLEECKEAGVKVIAYVRNILNSHVDAMISYSFRDMTKANAEYVMSKIDGGNVVFIGGDLAQAPDTTELDGGYHDVVDPYIEEGKVTSVLEQNVVGWKAETAMSLVENALSMTNNDLAAVFVDNDGMAYGAVQALEDAGLDGQVYVTGHDGELAALKLIAQGKMSATAFKPDDEIAKGAIDLAIRAVKGELEEPDYLYDNGYYDDIPAYKAYFITVTTENIDEKIIEAGYYTHEEIYEE